MKAVKVKSTPIGSGFQGWVLTRDDFSSQWIRASEILKEEPQEFRAAALAVEYAEKAMRKFNRSAK
jgi:hypothetical protein